MICLIDWSWDLMSLCKPTYTCGYVYKIRVYNKRTFFIICITYRTSNFFVLYNGVEGPSKKKERNYSAARAALTVCGRTRPVRWSSNTALTAKSGTVGNLATETNFLSKTLFYKAVSNHISLTMDMTYRARNEAIHELDIYHLCNHVLNLLRKKKALMKSGNGLDL